MSEKKFPLSLVVRAVDLASGPLKTLTSNINAATGPLSGLGKDFGRLGGALNLSGFGKVGGALKNVGAEVFGLAAKFAGLALGAGVAFAAMVKGAVDSGDKLGEMADRVGLTVDSYASLGFAAAQADVDQEAFNTSMDKLNKNMGLMTVGKGGEFLAFLNQVSPTFAKQVKGAKNTEEAFFLLADAMKKIDDPAKRAALSSAAFGKSGMVMGTFLHQGTAEILKQEAEYMRLAGSQEAFARGAGDLDNAIRETETAFGGLRSAAMGALFPALTKVSKVVTEFVVKNREGLARWAESTGNAISKWVDGGGLERLAGSLGRVADTVGKVIDFLGPMGVAVAAGAVAFAPLIGSIGSLGLALIGVAPQLLALGAFLLPLAAPALAVGAAIGALAWAGTELYKAWEPLKFIFNDWGNSLRWAVVDAWATVKPILEKLSLFGMIPGVTAAIAAGDAVSGQVMQTIEARRAITAQQARPQAPLQSEARVSVDFANLPAGARVSTSPTSSQPVDLNMSYASVMP